MEFIEYYVKPEIVNLIRKKTYFLPLSQYPDLIVDISSTPYTLRNRITGYITPAHQNGKYKAWYIEGKSIPIHQLLGSEFLIKDESYNGRLFIDHIDQDKENNTLENLRFVPPSLNGRNTNDEPVPVFLQLDRPMKIEEYEDKHFENLYYANGFFYILHNRLYYRVAWNKNKKNEYAHVLQTDGKGFNIYKKKFQKWLKSWIEGDEIEHIEEQSNENEK